LAPEPFRFARSGRSPRALLAVGGTWTLLVLAWAWLDAVWWLMALIALATLPALWDILRDTRAGLTISDTALTWYSGRREGQIALAEIAHMRFDTRWDFSVRVTAVLHGNKLVRLPHESVPPHRVLESQLTARGLNVKRHHFTIF